VISDVGVALAIPIEGASLSLVPVGEGMSAIGKGMKPLYIFQMAMLKELLEKV